MVRIKINFSIPYGSKFPFSYRYELSSWIYRILNQSDATFAQQLHETGYRLKTDELRRYKLFTFSPLNIFPFKTHKDQQVIVARTNEVSLQVSFYADAALKHFIAGLFQKQHLGLGTQKVPAVDMYVNQVEILPEPTFSNRHTYVTESGICLGVREAGKTQATYLSPQDRAYEYHLFKSIKHKYHTIQQHFSQLPPWASFRQEFDWYLLPRHKAVKPKLITIKAHTSAETKVKGFCCAFELKAPVPVQQLLYYSGLGEKSSMGFGWMDFLD